MKIPVFARLTDWFGPYRLPSGLQVDTEDGVRVAQLETLEGEKFTVTANWFNRVARIG
jgi:hypothetical protein